MWDGVFTFRVFAPSKNANKKIKNSAQLTFVKSFSCSAPVVEVDQADPEGGGQTCQSGVPTSPKDI